jgi:hypothetical protein
MTHVRLTSSVQGSAGRRGDPPFDTQSDEIIQTAFSIANGQVSPILLPAPGRSEGEQPPLLPPATSKPASPAASAGISLGKPKSRPQFITRSKEKGIGKV